MYTVVRIEFSDHSAFCCIYSFSFSLGWLCWQSWRGACHSGATCRLFIFRFATRIICLSEAVWLHTSFLFILQLHGTCLVDLLTMWSYTSFVCFWCECRKWLYRQGQLSRMGPTGQALAHPGSGCIGSCTRVCYIQMHICIMLLVCFYAQCPPNANSDNLALKNIIQIGILYLSIFTSWQLPWIELRGALRGHATC